MSERGDRDSARAAQRPIEGQDQMLARAGEVRDSGDRSSRELVARLRFSGAREAHARRRRCLARHVPQGSASQHFFPSRKHSKLAWTKTFPQYPALVFKNATHVVHDMFTDVRYL